MMHWIRRMIGSVTKRVTGTSYLARYGRFFLRDAFAAAAEAGVAPFLMWGTLLGAVRDGGFIAHDRDIDIGIRFEDYAKKDAFIAAMVRRGYRVGFDRPYKFRFAHADYSLHIDVDVFYPWDGKTICAFASRTGQVVGEVFAPDAFDRLRELDFLNGISVAVPDPPEPVLDAIYGAWRVVRRDYSSSDGPLNRLVQADGTAHRTVPVPEV